MRAGGIVLCGGRSSRMGRPKAWLPIDDESMLPRVVRLVAEAVGPVVVVAAPGQDVPPLPRGVRIVRDEQEGCGPLAGLAAGLAALGDAVDAAYLSACDVPFLRPAFVRAVVAGLAVSDAAIAIPSVGGFRQPLAAAYRCTVLPQVLAALATDRRGLVFLSDTLPSRILTADDLAGADPGLASLRNINTPADYAAAARMFPSVPSAENDP